MNSRSSYWFKWVASVIVLTMIFSGCANKALEPAAAPSSTPETIPPTQAVVEPTDAPSPTPEAIPPTQVAAKSTPEHGLETVADRDVLYHDSFADPTSGWPAEEKFDNYFIGYHEPEFYHVEVTSPNYKTAVYEPEKGDFSDVTIAVKAFTASSKTAETGDFSFGTVFRRSGDNFYAFTISQRAKKWYVLKSSPNALTVLAEGTEESIHDPEGEDVLRVDAQGASFFFHINDELVGQVTDPDYATGEVGLYLQTFDITKAHVHFDELTISLLEEPQPQASDAALYHDSFADPTSGWPAEEKFDNYFIGYHEPEYYHVEVTSPNYKTAVYEPEKGNFSDVTIAVKAFTASSKTAETGDFSFGTVFRRSGDNFYAFTISQRAKKWYVLKSSPNALTVLAEGTDESIHDPEGEDELRVDAQGSSFFFHINDELVGQVTDPDYATGEVGLFLQTFDISNAHVHFDELTISAFEPSLTCEVKALSLHVRSGPGTEYPPFTFLGNGDTIAPLGRSEDGEWLFIGLEGNDNHGWIYNSTSFLTCTTAVDNLPVTPP